MASAASTRGPRIRYTTVSIAEGRSLGVPVTPATAEPHELAGAHRIAADREGHEGERDHEAAGHDKAERHAPRRGRERERARSATAPAARTQEGIELRLVGRAVIDEGVEGPRLRPQVLAEFRGIQRLPQPPEPDEPID